MGFNSWFKGLNVTYLSENFNLVKFVIVWVLQCVDVWIICILYSD